MNVTLPAELTLENAAATLAAVRGSLVSGAKTTIDLSPLKKVDSSAITVLLGLQRYAAQHGISLAFCNIPTNLQSLAVLYGVDDLLPINA